MGHRRRGRWLGDFEYLFAVFALVIGLKAFWYYPFLMLKNGGSAFIIPFIGFLILFALPFMYLELDFGQFTQLGTISSFARAFPICTGVGVLQAIIHFIIASYVSVILTHILYYAYESIRYIGADHLPWEQCQHAWNTQPCVEYSGNNYYSNSTLIDSDALSSPARSFNRDETPEWQFYDNHVLSSPNLDQTNPTFTFWAPGGLVIHLLLTLIVTWGIVYFGIFLGALLLGKMLVLSVIVSMGLLVAVFIRGVTLPGAKDGLYEYWVARWPRLADVNTWFDAGSTVFFMASLGSGVLLTIGSYQRRSYEIHKVPYRHEHEIYHTPRSAWRYAILGVLVLFGSCLFFTLIVGSFAGVVARISGQSVEQVSSTGLSLLVLMFTRALTARLTSGAIWSLVLFAAIFILGIDGIWLSAETTLTAIKDVFPSLHHKLGRPLMALLFCLAGYALGLAMVTNAGSYLIAWFDWLILLPLFVVAFFSIIAFVWTHLYRHCMRVRHENRYHRHRARRTCGAFCRLFFLLPILLAALFVIVAAAYYAAPFMHKDYYNYRYPFWVLNMYWIIVGVLLGIVPFFALIQLCRNGRRAFRPHHDMVRQYDYDEWVVVDDVTNAVVVPHTATTIVQQQQRAHLHTPEPSGGLVAYGGGDNLPLTSTTTKTVTTTMMAPAVEHHHRQTSSSITASPSAYGPVVIGGPVPHYGQVLQQQQQQLGYPGGGHVPRGGRPMFGPATGDMLLERPMRLHEISTATEDRRVAAGYVAAGARRNHHSSSTSSGSSSSYDAGRPIAHDKRGGMPPYVAVDKYGGGAGPGGGSSGPDDATAAVVEQERVLVQRTRY